MKKIVFGLVLIFSIFSFCFNASAANTVRAAVALTGGGTGALDAIAIAGIENGDIAIVTTSDITYTYQFHCADTTAETSPYYIRPDSYGGTNACGADGQGVWYLNGTSRMMTVVDSGSGAYTISAAQARVGTFFVNTYAGVKTYNLPAAEAGMVVCVKNGQGNARALTVDTDGTDYIVMSTGARTSAAGDYYTAAASDAKNQVCLATFDATDWYVVSEVGTWAEQ